MIRVPLNPNQVCVGMVQTRCYQSQLNSNYPARLNGIISQHEFQESIHNINSKISSNKSQMFCFVFCILYIVGAIALSIAGAEAALSIKSSNIALALSIIGGILIGLGSTAAIIGICISIRGTNKMRQAIAEESNKYSIRSPGACTWRLNVKTIVTGSGRYRNKVYVYHIIIDIHRSRVPGGSANLHPNQSTSRPTSTVRPPSTVRPQDNILPPEDDIPPPPYPGPPVAFCFQCGAPKSEFTAKFCSVCGHRFENY